MVYTVLLVGGTDVGKHSLMSVIASALNGQRIVTNIFERTTDSPQRRDIRSKNGVLVSANIFECGVKA